MISRSIAAIGQPIWDCIASSTDEALQQRGLERGSHAEAAARGAALMASLVVRTHGAGLPERARQLWETRLGSDKLG